MDNFIAISIKTGIGFGIFNHCKIIRIKQKLPNSSIAKSKIQFPCAKAQTVKAAPLGPKMVKKSETAGRFSKIKTSLKASSLKRGLISLYCVIVGAITCSS